MTPDVIIAAIKDALGNPSGGSVAEAMPIIEKAVRHSFQPDKLTKETRVVAAQETR